MSYAKLGTSCKPITIACTSNHKYISPLDPVYFQPNTTMLQYPGISFPGYGKRSLSFKNNDINLPGKCQKCSSSS